MEIEEAALKKEEDPLSQGRLKALQKELAETKDRFNAQKAQWENEKQAISRIQQLRERIEELNRQIDQAQRQYDLEKAAELKYGRLPEAQRQLQEEERRAQQGTIEGMENPLATLYGQAYYEVAKYLTMTSHVKMPIHWITNEDFFQSLTPEQQQWLCETGDEAGEYNNQLQDELAAQYLEDMKAEGVEVIELDEEEFNKFADAARQVYSDPDVTAQWRDGLYDYVREIIES